MIAWRRLRLAGKSNARVPAEGNADTSEDDEPTVRYNVESKEKTGGPVRNRHYGTATLTLEGRLEARVRYSERLARLMRPKSYSLLHVVERQK